MTDQNIASTSDSTNPAVPESFELMHTGLGFTDVSAPIYRCERDGEAVFGFYVQKHHCNPMGICHGGMIMLMFDIILGGAAHRAIGAKHGLPTTAMSIDFVGPAMVGDWIESSVTFDHLSKNLVLVGGILQGPNGVIARANGSFKRPRE